MGLCRAPGVHTLLAMTKVVVAVVAPVVLSGCSHTPTAPSAHQLSDFLAAVSSSAAIPASQHVGTMPSANGGPALTVSTQSAAVPPGGALGIGLFSERAFQTIFVGVGGTTGFYQLTLPTPVNTIVIIEQAPAVVASAFDSVISVATPEGAVGPRVVIHTTLIARSAEAKGRLTIDFWPSPAHVGNRPTMIVREVGGVGVTATRVTFRGYDSSGNLLLTSTVTDERAWFTCDNTPQKQMAHLAALGVCTMVRDSSTLPQQLEFDQVVRDDNGHDLVFTSPRLVTLP